MSYSPASPEDVAFIARQIGRSPVGLVGVAARCALHPAVAVTYPIRRGPRPFPTLFWLTCPQLRRALSRLEMAGAVGEMERIVRGDSSLLARLEVDHERYIEARLAVLSGADRVVADTNSSLAGLHTRGIGGMTDLTAIKCLHLHYAHHLALGSVVGELLERRYDIRPCGVAEPIPSCLTS